MPYSTNDYYALLDQIIDKAVEMVGCLPPAHRPSGTDILDFLRRYSCRGWPTGRVGEFTIGHRLNGQARQGDQYDVLTVITCFQDDVKPLQRPSDSAWITPGTFSKKNQVILLFEVDCWSLPELALFLLHEGRHARHRLGSKLAQLPPLDLEELHESNTWMVTINTLAAWGGEIWERAVGWEVDWLRCSSLPQISAKQIAYQSSQTNWPELDLIFGSTSYEPARRLRQELLAVQANMIYWSEQNPTLRPEQICHSIVSHLYR